ncbi:uracil-DNA glycosylase [Rhodohalobacter mucosus]|uniref:Type-4 uracil-DNA glycosylase n=1 Tax=Rhodohalobacter mucosus TaxID=2079485 RepID=A0A316TS10_9BACT|nr:uracil-DNA glycosylase [Rhodohalobacter mucosus]PWN06648.1 uracil-DNA glycosylase [Rhodohalobacter mucosus]
MEKPDSVTEKELLQYLEFENEVFGAFSIPDSVPDDSDGAGTQKDAAHTQSESDAVSDSVSETDKEQDHSEREEPVSLSIEERLAKCSTLEDLYSFCETADELRTDLDNTNLVFGVGNPSADLMIIGEAPGEQEDIQGEPFVGAAGQLLNKILKAIRFSREDVYIANILKHRPPGNRNPSTAERERSLPYLLRQIDLIQPRLILCLGRVSGTTLLGREESLKNLRGQFYPFRGAELAVTYHPAALLRNPQWKRPVWEDVQQVRKRYDELAGTP